MEKNSSNIPTPNNPNAPDKVIYNDQVAKRVNKLFFEPQTNPRSRYQKLFEVFGLMIVGMMISVFVKIGYFNVPSGFPFLSIVYFGIFLTQVAIIRIKNAEAKALVFTGVFYLVTKFIFDYIYQKFGIIQNDNIFVVDIEYTLFSFVMGYLFLLFIRYRFKFKFVYVIVVYHIIFVFTFDLYWNHYFTNPSVQYPYILIYWVFLELFYYTLLYWIYHQQGTE